MLSCYELPHVLMWPAPDSRIEMTTCSWFRSSSILLLMMLDYGLEACYHLY